MKRKPNKLRIIGISVLGICLLGLVALGLAVIFRSDIRRSRCRFGRSKSEDPQPILSLLHWTVRPSD